MSGFQHERGVAEEGWWERQEFQMLSLSLAIGIHWKAKRVICSYPLHTTPTVLKLCYWDRTQMAKHRECAYKLKSHIHDLL